MMKKKLAHEPDYKVGYCKPPQHSQFKKGQSGNPGGTSKSQKSLKQLLRDEGERTVNITENGEKLTITKKELIAKAITAKACKGDLAAVRLVMSHYTSSEPKSLIPDFSWDAEEEALLEELRKLIEEAEG